MNIFTLGRPELAAAIEPLLRAREAIGRQIVDLDRKVRRLAQASDPMRHLMIAPSVTPIKACAFSPRLMIPRALPCRAASAPISA